MKDVKISVKELLTSGLYETRRGKIVSKYYPKRNFLFPPAQVNKAEEASIEEEKTPGRAPSGLTMKWRPISLVVGDPSMLSLARRGTYRRTRDDFDTGWAFHGLKQHLLIPNLRAYIVDDHHLLYYILCEASALGLIEPSQTLLVNFDAHHDIAPISVLPPPDICNLPLQAKYAVTYLRLGTHIAGILRAGLAKKAIWFTNVEELAIKCSDMDEELATDEKRFEIRFLDDTVDDFFEGMDPRQLVISLDWDYLSARYHEGFVLEEVTAEMIDDFVEQLKRIGIRKNSWGLLFICTSPSYTEESTLIPGIRHFLDLLETHLNET